MTAKTYSYYLSLVLVELCDFGGAAAAARVVGHASPHAMTVSSLDVLVSLLRQSVERQDKKVTCVVCTLLLWCVYTYALL